MKIGIDPGHGGKDPGAVGADGTKEKDIVLSISEMVRDLAEKRGHYTYMTRDDDDTLSLKGRYTFFNKSGVDVAISIHANASTNKEARGCWLIHKNSSWFSQNLCFYIRNQTREQCPSLCEKNDPKIFDAIRASGKRLSMIYGPKAKGTCLIETAFISNKDDRDLLLKKSVQKGIAKAIVYGAEAWSKANGIK